MRNYLLAYKGGEFPQTEDERDQVMAAWGKWFASLRDAVVDAGNPFGPAKAISPDGSVGDTEAGLTGYSIVSADSLEDALEHARGCPILAGGGSVEVYEGFAVM